MKQSPPETSLTLGDIVDSYHSAQDALKQGGHYAALLLAKADGDAETHGCALIMCGWMERGVKHLEDIEFRHRDTPMYQAFGYWCMGQRELAIKTCDDDRFSRVLGKDRNKVLLICSPETERGIPSETTADMEIRSICIEKGEGAPAASEILNDGFDPDIVIVLNVFGANLPEGLFELSAPILIWTYDFDFHMPSQSDDLSRADIILASTESEQFALNQMFDGRTAAFITHDIYTDSDRFGGGESERDIDIFHSGLSFTPMMRGKAKFLYDLATIDDPDLEIRINQGFLDRKDYADHLSRSKFVAVFARFCGGFQTRAVDTICHLTSVLSPKGSSAREILEEEAERIMEIETDRIQKSTLTALKNYLPSSQSQRNLIDIFKTSPDREIRLIRYAIFQSIFVEKTKSRPSPAKEDGASRSEKLQTAISKLMSAPHDGELRAKTISRFKAGTVDFPDSLIIHFEFARLLWALGDKSAAVASFETCLNLAKDGAFNPMQERLYFHLLGAANEMTPYEDYYSALVADQIKKDYGYPTARKIILATSNCYIGLFHLQNGEMGTGLKVIRQSLNTCPFHFPAARLYAKALYGAGCPADEITAAVYDCIALFPPYLTELLAYVVEAEKSLGNEEAAVSIVRDWAYFITRVKWLSPKEHPIPEATWAAAMEYLDKLPPKLQRQTRERHDEWQMIQNH